MLWSSLILTNWEEGEFESDYVQLLKSLHRHQCPIFFSSFYASSEDTHKDLVQLPMPPNGLFFFK